MEYKSEKGHDFENQTSKIIGACIEVHKNLGPGFMEVIYQRALAHEFRNCGLEFEREVNIQVYYKDIKIGKRRVDFVVEDIMLEIKAKSEMAKQDYVQTLSYLKASGYKIGLLINFGTEKIEVRRLLN